MENVSAIAITSFSEFTDSISFNMFNHQQKEIHEMEISVPTNEKIEYLNKIGHEYPFCVFHKHKKNDPL